MAISREKMLEELTPELNELMFNIVIRIGDIRGYKYLPDRSSIYYRNKKGDYTHEVDVLRKKYPYAGIGLYKATDEEAEDAEIITDEHEAASVCLSRTPSITGQSRCGALGLALKAVIVIAGHKCLPYFAQTVPPDDLPQRFRRFIQDAFHDLLKVPKSEFKNFIPAAFFVDLPLSGQGIDRAGLDAAHAGIADIYFEGSIRR